MENKNYLKIVDITSNVCHDMILSGYQKEQTFREIEAIFFLAVVTKNNNCPISLINEKTLRNYFKESKDVNNISLEKIFQNIVFFNDNVQILLNLVTSLSNDEIMQVFELIEEKKLIESDRYTSESSTTKDIAKLVMNLFPKENKASFADICSGEGLILSEASKIGYKKLFGYEINLNAALLSKMRATINQKIFNIYVCDVLQEKMNHEYDCVFTQPPFSLRTFKTTVKDEDETLKYKESDHTIKADWHFVLKAINATKEKGKTIALVAAGTLFNTPDVYYRKQIIDNKKLEMVIELPSGIIPGVGISTDILVFSNNNKEIKFVDASDCYLKSNGYKKKLDLNRIIDLLNTSPSDKVALVSYKDVVNKNYQLSVARYINTNIYSEIPNPVKLKYYAEVIPGFQYTTRNIHELEPDIGSVGVIKITNIINGEIDYSKIVSIDINDFKVSKYLLKENDILVATKGTMLKFAIVENIGSKKLIPHSNMTIIRCNKKLNPLYLISFLKSEAGMTTLKSIQTGSIIMNITQRAIEDFMIPIVDEDVQRVIASRYKIINNNVNKIKKDLESAEKKLETLWEDEVSN